MHIGIDARSMIKSRSGIGQSTYYLTKHLLDIDAENDYHLFYHKEIDADWIAPDSVQLHRVRTGNITLGLDPRERWEQIMLPLSLLRHRVDVYHAIQQVGPLWAPAPVIVTVFDVAFLVFPETKTPEDASYWSTWVRRSVRRAERVIATSEATKRDLVNLCGTPPERIVTIPLGVDPRFRPAEDAEQARQICSRYGAISPFVLYVGNIEPRKNLVRLVAAYHRLKGRYKDLPKLVICGEKGWLYDDVFRTVEELNLQEDVLFIGYVSHYELMCLYTEAQALLYPSLYEGFGLPILEAMACGTPVVTSNVSSMPEVAGDAAILVDPYSEAEIADAIEAVLTDATLHARLINRGFAQAKRFTWTDVARRTLDVYREVATGKRHR